LNCTNASCGDYVNSFAIFRGILSSLMRINSFFILAFLFVLLGIIFNFVLCTFFEVGLNIEIGEHGEEHGAVAEDDEAVEGREAAVDEDGLDGVEGEGSELDHLHLGEVLLPPEVLVDLGPEGGHEVVEVHDGVDAHVEETAKHGLAASDIPDPPPGSEGHDAVVDHVKSGEVVELLPEDKEDGVDVVDELGEEVPPRHVHRVQRARAVRVVHRLAHPAVPTSQPECAGPIKHPGAEEGLEEIVGEHDTLYLVRGTVLHKTGPPHSHHVIIQEAAPQDRPRRPHEQ